MQCCHCLLTLQQLAENSVLPIQPRAFHKGNEELRTVGVGPSVGHGQKEGLVMFKLKILVCELSPVNGFTSSAVVVGEISPLRHEIGDNSMEV